MAAAFLAGDSQGQHLGNLITGAGRVKQRFQRLLAVLKDSSTNRNAQKKKQEAREDMQLAPKKNLAIYSFHTANSPGE